MTMPDFTFAGSTAVLTGAAGGMGEHMARLLAGRGTSLALVDRDADGLKKLADELATRHADLVVRVYVADLSDRDEVDYVVSAVLADFPSIDLLVNNAGVALGGAFADVSAEDFDWVMNVNFQAPVRLVRGLLPRLAESPGSHVVNVSSLFGLIAPPGQSAYAASKFALRGFSEALRHELVERSIGVTTVHPGGIKTQIAASARMASAGVQAEKDRQRFEKLLTFPADKAAEQIVDGIAKRKPRVLIAFSARSSDFFARLLPASYMTAIDLLSGRRSAGRRR
jgi:short-subunit dehydrogenase